MAVGHAADWVAKLIASKIRGTNVLEPTDAEPNAQPESKFRSECFEAPSEAVSPSCSV